MGTNRRNGERENRGIEGKVFLSPILRFTDSPFLVDLNRKQTQLALRHRYVGHVMLAGVDLVRPENTIIAELFRPVG